MDHQSSDVTSNISKWLREQGYPLEMEVASKFAAVGFDVKQSDRFVDLEENKFREIDVVASKYDWALRVDCGIEVSFNVECKSSFDKPWIVFYPNQSHQIRSLGALSATYKKFLEKYGIDDLFETKVHPFLASEFHQNPFLQKREHGYGVVQAFNKDKATDITYQAIQSAIRASICRPLYFESRLSANRNVNISFPIVVIGSPLYECKFVDSNNFLLNETPFASIKWQPAPELQAVTVQIVSVSKVTEIASYASEAANSLIKHAMEFQNELSKTIDESNQNMTGVFL